MLRTIMSEQNKFQSGNVVILKSGGPRMTVVEQTENGVHCIWFVMSAVDKVHSEVFEPATLRLDKDSQ